MTTGTASVENLVQSSFSEAWELFKDNAVLIVLASLVATIVMVVSLGILTGPMTVGMIGIVRKRLRGEAASVTDVFDGLSSFGTSFVTVLLVAVGVIVGSILCLLPGLVFAVAAVFSLHEVTYRSAGAVDAIKGSMNLVKENVGSVVVLLLAAIVVSAVCGLVPIIGAVLSTAFVTVLILVAYEKLAGFRQ